MELLTFGLTLRLEGRGGIAGLVGALLLKEESELMSDITLKVLDRGY